MSEELAWAAGFFDGEGTFWLKPTMRAASRSKPGAPRKRHYYPCASASQRTLEPLERLQEATQLGKISTRNNRGSWVWHVRADATLVFFELVKPYLCSIKIAQAERVFRGELSDKQKERLESLSGFYPSKK